MEPSVIPKAWQAFHEIWTLGKISLNYHFVLMDTCAIISHRQSSKILSEKKILNLEESAFRSTIDFAETHPVYVTKRVLDEVTFDVPKNLVGYNDSNLDLRKFYTAIQAKKRNSNLSGGHHVGMNNARNYFGTQEKLRRNLPNILKTINLENSSIYDVLREGFKPFFPKKLSETDKDFLVHGLLLSCFMPTAIVTRDGGICDSYFAFMKDSCYRGENYFFDRFGCFDRIGKNDFETYLPVSNKE